MTNILKVSEQLVTAYVNHDAASFKSALGDIFEKIRSTDWQKYLAMARDVLDKLEAFAKLLNGGNVQTLAVTDLDMPFITTAFDEMLGAKGGITLDSNMRQQLIELFTSILLMYLRSRGLFPTLSMERSSEKTEAEMADTPTPSIPNDADDKPASDESGESAGDPSDKPAE